MVRPLITLACSLYDRMLPLYLGEASVEGFELRFQAARSLTDVRKIFDNVTSSGGYDVAEMSIAEYLTSSQSQSFNYVGLPVFPSRAFRSNSIFVRTDRINKPQDLCR